ncbi:MAG: HAMP domain-containing sensor histidine kinase [Mariprofundaceae bacterium]
MASLLVLALFFVVLMLAEAGLYTLTGHAVSIWAMVLAALAAALFFSPMTHGAQAMIDRLFFRHHLDTREAIRELGAGDLADLPQENIESALLQRICAICHRTSIVLDERDGNKGRVFCFPEDVIIPPTNGKTCDDYEMVFPIEKKDGVAWLYLGRRHDGWPADAEELESLSAIAKFAAMSLEHARLSHQQAQTARLDSFSRVTSQLHSHDLKNRLHDLSFLAHHIGSGKLDADDTSRLVVSIRKVVGRMQTLMQRVADPNAPLHPNLALCDLSELLRQSIEDRLWPEGIRIHIDLPQMPPIAGDSTMLQGVFENVFDNAVQSMKKQGDIYISCQQQGDDQLEVSVRDTGCGMSSSFNQHRLFRLFATSKDNGLGIGLYLSRRIIDAHHGQIRAESEGEGKGSTFFISLPLWQNGSCLHVDTKEKAA